MEFDQDALRGIIEALNGGDFAEVHKEAVRRGAFDCPIGSEGRRAAVQAVLVELGHILPFETNPIDAGVEEYEEAMLAQELLEGIQ